MKNDLDKLMEIKKGASTMMEAASLFGNNFSSAKDDFANVGNVVSSILHECKENKKLDVQHEAIKFQLTRVVCDFKLKQQFLENTFAERREIIHKHFEVIDFAMANNNDELILEALANVSKVVSDSPLKNFKAFREVLNNEKETLHLDF